MTDPQSPREAQQARRPSRRSRSATILTWMAALGPFVAAAATLIAKFFGK